MKADQLISVELIYEKDADGRYYVKSDDIPGFRLAGADWDALQKDLNPVVSDLLLHNLGFIVEELRWVPGPTDLKKHLDHPASDGRATYVARVKLAA